MIGFDAKSLKPRFCFNQILKTLAACLHILTNWSTQVTPSVIRGKLENDNYLKLKRPQTTESALQRFGINLKLNFHVSLILW